jgi:hypothetical protein
MELTELWNITSKICITATPTNVYNRTYIFLHVYIILILNSQSNLIVIVIKNRIGCLKN